MSTVYTDMYDTLKNKTPVYGQYYTAIMLYFIIGIMKNRYFQENHRALNLSTNYNDYKLYTF